MKTGIILLLSLGLNASSVEYYYFLASQVAPVRLCGSPKVENDQIILNIKGGKTPAVYVNLERDKFEKFKRDFFNKFINSICVFSETWPKANGDHFVIEAHHYSPLPLEDTVSGFSIGNH